MKTIPMHYGTGTINLNIPDHVAEDVFMPTKYPGLVDAPGAIRDCLEQPLDLDLPGLFSQAGKRATVAIAINDKTRPVPLHVLLPPIMDWLGRNGISKDAITLLIASGTHVPMQTGEIVQVLPGETAKNCRVLVHDCDDQASLAYLGETKRGTPVYINRLFSSADIRIVVGDIEPHHFMGYSGGVKPAAIGLASRETIRRNHAFITHPDARTACYESNPMRQDVEEIGRMIPVHMAVNAILNDDREIVRVLAGEPLAVMAAGIPLVRQMCQIHIPNLYDLVIASAGGHPKDINFYQAQKGLTHAAMITRPGGAILLAAACPEGAGNNRYEEWIGSRTSHQQVLEDFLSVPFEIGIHKAYLVSRIAAAKRVIVFSEMPAETCTRLILEQAVTFQGAFDQLIQDLGPGARVAVMPQAVLTVPDQDIPGKAVL